MAALPALPAVPCTDRANHHGLVPAGAIMLPCTSFAHPGPSAPADPHWHQQNCSMTFSTNHGDHIGPYQVCGRCDDRLHSQPRALQLYRDVVSKSPLGPPAGGATPPWPPPGANGLRFSEFWTRLCRACERVEQERFFWTITEYQILLAAGLAISTFPGTPAGWRDMHNYPWNHCTCIKRIGWYGHRPPQPPGPPHHPVHHASQPPLSILHPHGNWKQRYCIADFDATMDDLEIRRDANDQWLKHTSRTPDGKLCLASKATIRRRETAQNSSARACHCGADPDTTPAQAEVLLCMGCGNLRCLVMMGTPGSIYPRPTRIRRSRKLNPDLVSQPRGVGSMELGRTRQPFYDNRGR